MGKIPSFQFLSAKIRFRKLRRNEVSAVGKIPLRTNSRSPTTTLRLAGRCVGDKAAPPPAPTLCSVEIGGWRLRPLSVARAGGRGADHGRARNPPCPRGV